VRETLERVAIPGEEDARGRAWDVVRAAHAEREPTPAPSRWPRVAVVAIVLAVVAAGVASAPGRAVLDELREVVGVERADPALFSLPAPGRLLVSSDAGVWVVQEDGSKRLLGDYREASWSPFGRFVVAARENELAALEADGDVRWTLARPGVSSPRWTGTETDTRIAYVDRSGVRVVAGDGTDDRLVVGSARGPLAWRPGRGFELAYVDRAGRVAVVDLATGETWRGRRDGRVIDLEWSSDGRRLVVTSAEATNDVAVYTASGLLYTGFRQQRGSVTSVAIQPGRHDQAIATYDAGQSQLLMPRVRGSALAGPGSLSDLTWSPDARWLLAGWPTADQWVFVHADGKRIRAISNVSRQFRSDTAPRIEGWCCAG
jgi:hypothetical protein